MVKLNVCQSWPISPVRRFSASVWRPIRQRWSRWRWRRRSCRPSPRRECCPREAAAIRCRIRVIKIFYWFSLKTLLCHEVRINRIMFNVKFADEWIRTTNHLESEVTALPTAPQPLPKSASYFINRPCLWPYIVSQISYCHLMVKVWSN